MEERFIHHSDQMHIIQVAALFEDGLDGTFSILFDYEMNCIHVIYLSVVSANAICLPSLESLGGLSHYTV